MRQFQKINNFFKSTKFENFGLFWSNQCEFLFLINFQLEKTAKTYSFSLVSLHFLEIRQAISIIPFSSPFFALPTIKIFRISPNKAHCVQRRTSAPNTKFLGYFESKKDFWPSPGPVNDPIVQIFLSSRVIKPVVFIVTEIVHQSGRHVDPPVPPMVLWTGFDQQNAVVRVLGQTIGWKSRKMGANWLEN